MLKMQCNPEPNKQANEVIFSFRSDSAQVFQLSKFNNSSIAKFPNQKILGIVLDSKFNFSSHVDQSLKNVTN